MLKRSTEVMLIAAMLAAVLMGFIVVGIHMIFHMQLSTWLSPWAWGPGLFLWTAMAGKFVEGFVPYEALRYMDQKSGDE